MNYYSISAFINAAVSIILGLFVLYKNYHSKLNKSVFFWCFTVFTWAFFYFIWQIEVDATKALLWTRLLMLGAIWVSLAYFKVVVIFLDIEDQQKKITYFGYFLSIIFTLLLVTPLMVKNVEPLAGFLFWPKPGLAYAPFLVMFLGYTFYGLHISIRALKEPSPLKKAQIKFMLFGMAISIIGGSTNYFLWYGIPIKPYGNILASTYVLLTAYAIVVHHLMDIKIVLRRYSVFLVSLSFILTLATAVKYFFERFFYNYSIWADPIILIIALFSYPIVKNYFYRIANRYFFSSLYDSNEVIANVSDKLRSTLDINNIYKFIADILTKAFHTKAIGVFVYDNKNADYIVQYNRGFDVAENSKFVSDEKLSNAFIAQNKALIVDEVLFGNYPTDFSNNKTVKLLSKLGVEILMPLNIEDKAIGLIILGKKESGDMYNDDDLQVLKVAGAQIAISMENGLLYQETKNFNIKLEKEVGKATYDLRKANEQLKKLDSAKSEFISIASHQLRTPLTIIKDYVSMMLEGNFGKLTDMTKQSLEKVFQSNERLIQLVEDLLNISRIESGRMQFNFVKADLGKITANVVDELSVYSKKKNLLLKYKQSDNHLPLIKADEGKIRQVIMNLIDNAIKYTKQGKITVEIKSVDKQIRFCVTDSGMGIKQENIINLFKKFFRGKGTSLINANGMGLGLYVARIIIEQHHGKIWAESNGENKGSKFCFELPAGECRPKVGQPLAEIMKHSKIF